MRISNAILPYLLGMVLSTATSAEIYQSKDAQGNTVYSDMPSQGAAAVKVAPTNSADPVEITPSPPSAPDTPATPRKTSAKPASSSHQGTSDDYLYYGGDNDNDTVDDRTRKEKRRDNDGVAKPKRDRPVKVEPHRNVARPTSGGSGRR